MFKKYKNLALPFLGSILLFFYNYIINKKFIVCYYNLNQHPLSGNFFEFLTEINFLAKSLNKNIKLNIINDDVLKMASNDSLSQMTRYNYFILQPLSFFSEIRKIIIKKSDIKSIPLFSFKNTIVYNGTKNHKYILNYLRKNPSNLNFKTENFQQVENWLENKNINPKKLITLTLRTKKDANQRNSRLKDWIKFYEFLKSKNFNPIFIPDLEGPVEFLEDKNYNFCLPASYNFVFRLHLMKTSKLNIFVNTGPSTSALYFNNNYIFIKPISKSDTYLDDWVSEKAFINQGFVINKDIEYFENKYFRKIVWDEDNFENLKKSFEEFENF